MKRYEEPSHVNVSIIPLGGFSLMEEEQKSLCKSTGHLWVWSCAFVQRPNNCPNVPRSVQRSQFSQSFGTSWGHHPKEHAAKTSVLLNGFNWMLCKKDSVCITSSFAHTAFIQSCILFHLTLSLECSSADFIFDEPVSLAFWAKFYHRDNFEERFYSVRRSCMSFAFCSSFPSWAANDCETSNAF